MQSLAKESGGLHCPPHHNYAAQTSPGNLLMKNSNAPLEVASWHLDAVVGALR